MACEWFRFDRAASVVGFAAIDDRVMGGCSRSQLRHDPAGHAVFEGQVSLQAGGGFASVRAPIGAVPDARAQGCQVELLGDGKRYKLGLRVDGDFDGLSYQAALAPPAGVWTVLQLPWTAFEPTWRGRPVPDAPALRPEALRQLGLLIGDRQAGPFALGLRSIILV